MGRYPALQKPVNDHSFESGVLEQGIMQDRGSRGPGLGSTELEVGNKDCGSVISKVRSSVKAYLEQCLRYTVAAQSCDNRS